MKTQRKRTVLAVDDDEINLMILTKTIQEAGFTAKAFTAGEAALEYLLAHPDDIDIALLDKMMPGVNGIEMLKRIKLNKALRHMPVIFQTGDVGMEQIREGLDNGAYYYLTKPFHPEILEAILHSAASECSVREELLEQMSEGHAKFLGLMREGDFVLKTHADARLLAANISQAAIYPEFVAIGLMELLSNAIEHGNLEIGYDRKRKALWGHSWAQELAARAENPEYANRFVHVRMEKIPQGLHILIRDEGKGFDWQHHLYDEGAPGKLNEPNGRGIAKAMIMLDELRYNSKGNEVQCIVCLPASLSVMPTMGASPNALHS